jgi:hypothetical protein
MQWTRPSASTADDASMRNSVGGAAVSFVVEMNRPELFKLQTSKIRALLTRTSGETLNAGVTFEDLVLSPQAVAISAPELLTNELPQTTPDRTPPGVPASSQIGIRALDWNALSPFFDFGAMDGLTTACLCLTPTHFEVIGVAGSARTVAVTLHFPAGVKRLFEANVPTYTLHIATTKSDGAVQELKSSTFTVTGSEWRVEANMYDAHFTAVRSNFATDEMLPGDYSFTLDVGSGAGATCSGAVGVLTTATTIYGDDSSGGSTAESTNATNTPSVTALIGGTTDVHVKSVVGLDGRSAVHVAWTTPAVVGPNALFEIAVGPERSVQGDGDGDGGGRLVRAETDEEKRAAGGGGAASTIIISARAANARACDEEAGNPYGGMTGTSTIGLKHFTMSLHTLGGLTTDEHSIRVRRVFVR